MKGEQETQESICTWANGVFGPAIDLPRWYTRLMEEIGELGEAVLDESAQNVAKECADVLIMLYRIAGTTGFDLHMLVDRKMAINRSSDWNHKGGVGHRKRSE